jgi:AbrB family looped-hinge helix DNA binding protein
MTFGEVRMARSNLVRVQEKGQVTLPVSVREQLGIKRGDLVAVSATPEGVLITPQRVVASALLDEIGEALAEQGLTLDELIESGREIRGELLREMYGIDSNGSD